MTASVKRFETSLMWSQEFSKVCLKTYYNQNDGNDQTNAAQAL